MIITDFKLATNIFKKVAVEVKSSVAKTSLYDKKSSPFQMDAKAMLSKFNAEQPIEIDSEKMINDVFKEINPINSKNFEHIKSNLSELLKKNNSDLSELVSDANNPYELFKLIKQNGINLIEKKAMENSYIRKNEFGRLPYEKQDNEFQILRLKVARSYRTITHFLTPKSSNPDVIKIEQYVRKLGIKDVNFSNDIEQAQAVKSAVEDLITAKIPLPHSMTITPLLPTGTHGMNLNFTNKHKGNGYVYLATTKERNLYKNLTEVKKQKIAASDDYKIKNRKNQNWSSTKNSKHTIYHEIAHTFQPSSYFDSVIFSLMAEERVTAAEISEYAGINKLSDAMPEMFAMLMDGQKLTEKQMHLYLKLGGIVPQI